MHPIKSISYCLQFVLLIVSLSSIAQTKTSTDLIQFSGVVVSGDSLKPVPFAAIIIKNTARGTISDYYGFFSFVAKKNDTIEFSSLGFKKSWYIIPDTLKENKYSLIQMLSADTIMLKETIIYPWPSQEQFREAFINLSIPDDDMERAKKNLAREEMREKINATPTDASLSYKYASQERQSRLYYIGQYQPNNLLNPIAWAKFIEAWQRGDFKKKKKTE